MKVAPAMQRFAFLTVSALTVCCFAGDGPPTSRPATSRSATSLSEPIADHRIVGRLYTLEGPGALRPLTQVVISPGLNAERAAKNGDGRVTPDRLQHLMSSAKPIAPDDELLDAWSYAPWCNATFSADGRNWSVALYLGGLGILRDDAGRRGAFHFDATAGDGG